MLAKVLQLVQQMWKVRCATKQPQHNQAAMAEDFVSIMFNSFGMLEGGGVHEAQAIAEHGQPSLSYQGEIRISCTDEDQLCRGLLDFGARVGMVEVSWFGGDAMHLSLHLARHGLNRADQHDAHVTEFLGALGKSSLPSSFCCRQVFPNLYLMI